MGEKDICPGLVPPDVPKSFHQRLQAVLRPEAGVNQKVPVPPPDKIGIQLPERVSREGDADPRDPAIDLFGYAHSPTPRPVSPVHFPLRRQSLPPLHFPLRRQSLPPVRHNLRRPDFPPP